MGSEGRRPKVSVVLPTYNQAYYLISAIQTVLNQTYSDFELIVVNDGSTDETSAILNSIRHPQVRVINQANQRLPSALNSGFAAARGEYFTWTSTDNIVAPTWLEELVKALEACPPSVGYAFSGYGITDAEGKIQCMNREQRFDIPSLLMRHLGNASFLYRAELAKKVGEYDPALCYAEDLDMWVRMAEHTRAVHVNTILYYYRQHPNAMTTQQDKVRAATQGVVNKFLAKTSGLFQVDNLFPSIALSADPQLERWKSRIWLGTLGASALYYCPIDALLDQFIRALQENYQEGLVGNIVYLLASASRWQDASQIVRIYQKKAESHFLAQLADIIARQAKSELLQIPYMTIEEKLLATDCQGLGRSVSYCVI